MADRARLILRNFLSPEICKELEFIHRSCSTVGYRPNVFSTTLSHLIATNSSHLIMPFVPIRERLKEKVEEYFGCEYELFVEFTGLISYHLREHPAYIDWLHLIVASLLINRVAKTRQDSGIASSILTIRKLFILYHLHVSWCKGASIGWHSDDNRAHLKQRDFSAVCYLNNYEVDFFGGLFHFQDGEPSTIAPMAGDVVIYTADDRNIHSVSEISEGERITLALWFSRDASHDEDTKLVESLSNCSLSSHISSIKPCLPILASTNMYWFPPEEASRFHKGFNICFARLHLLGFDICLSENSDKESQSARDSSSRNLKLLEEPLCLTYGNELLSIKFVNILHALQVVQFYTWKAAKIEEVERRGPCMDVLPISELQREQMNCLKGMFLKDVQLAETLARRSDCRSSQKPLDRFGFSSVVCEWEAYTLKLRNELVMKLPYWRRHRSIFCVANLD